MAANVTTLGSGSSIRLGVYDSTSLDDIYPLNRLFDSGALSSATTGVKTATATLTLQQGKLYWACYVAGTAAPTVRALAVAGCAPSLGLDAAMGTATGVGYTGAFTFGALPATYPAGQSALSAVPIPAIAMRLT